MKRWASFCRLVCFATVLLVRNPAGANEGQEPLRDDSVRVESLLETGRQFEAKRQWGEAVSHYEDALREIPHEKSLARRLTIARLYFDLQRRSGDASYLKLIQLTSQQQAMDLLSEIMLKIQSNYVEPPDWNAMLRTGTTGLSIALNDSEFRRLNGVRSSGSTQSIIQHIWKSQVARDFRSRQQVQDFIQWAAQNTERAVGVPPTATILEYACDSMSALDNYSAYLTGDQLDEVYSQIEGNFVGLGVELKADDGMLLIADVIPNGPAERSGIQAGDRIFEVDGRLTKDLSTDKAADMLKGEQGTYVSVRVLRPNGESLKYAVRRERVDVPSVERAAMIDSQFGIAYIKISSFQKSTARDVDTALWQLHGQGMKMLVVDVRGNPGGLLTESVEVADRFLLEGTIVETRGRNVRENYGYKAHRAGTWRVPLVVLIDGESASASEIFAAAIRDHRRGTVVGERSYGKGSVQGIFPLQVARGGVRLTTAKFYSPDMHAISQGGIEPDVAVRITAKLTDDGETISPPGEDPILDAGLDVARRMVAQRNESRERSER